jgi:rhodanese-related sulfurtransferase
LFLSFSSYAAESENKVNITAEIASVVVHHQGIPVTIERVQDTENRLADDFTKTSRPCPPFCIHPIEAAKGIRTIGELELLAFLQKDVAEERGLLIDARMPNWYNSETIPGSVNVPFIILTKPSDKRTRILKLMGAKIKESGEVDFANAINLALFCNGPWCDQSPRAIKGLINAGYPPEKIAYYRGGMQAWKSFGLTTVLPTSNAVDKE